MGTILLAFYVLCIIHGKRILGLILNPEREVDSESDGKTRSLFTRLPHGNSWAWCRMVYEPLAFIMVGIAFYLVHLFDLFAALYFVTAGLAMSLKSVFIWYSGWDVVRSTLDSKYRLTLLERINGGMPVPESIGRVPVGSLPMVVAADDMPMVLAKVTGLEGEYKSLLNSVRKASA